MGNSKPRRFSEPTILTEYHRRYSLIFSEHASSILMTVDDLLKVFPNRTLFCHNFHAWMQTLSYKKTANKESFIFACEILTLDSCDVISPTYKNHSFVFIELFLHMCLQKSPKENATVNQQQLINFAQTLTNFFFKDQNKLEDLAAKIVDIIKLQTNISSEPIPLAILIK